MCLVTSALNVCQSAETREASRTVSKGVGL
jgi:hypothetical protein